MRGTPPIRNATLDDLPSVAAINGAAAPGVSVLTLTELEDLAAAATSAAGSPPNAGRRNDARRLARLRRLKVPHGGQVAGSAGMGEGDEGSSPYNGRFAPIYI